jgi:hypothetical protein
MRRNAQMPNVDQLFFSTPRTRLLTTIVKYLQAANAQKLRLQAQTSSKHSAIKPNNAKRLISNPKKRFSKSLLALTLTKTFQIMGLL